MTPDTSPDAPAPFHGRQTEPYPTIDSNVVYRIALGLGDGYNLSPAETDSIASETNWDLVEDAVLPKGYAGEQIGRGKIPCPLCGGARRVHVHHVGRATGLHVLWPVVCPCIAAILFWKTWGDPKLTPLRFRAVRLFAMEPNPNLRNSVDAQAAFLAQAKLYVGCRSFLLLGPPNSGKSHLAMAMLRCELSAWANEARRRSRPVPAVWRINAVEYLRECFLLANARGQVITEDGRTFELDPEEPSVSARKIQAAAKAGFAPVLMIEELDKVSIRTVWDETEKINEFRFNELFAVIDEVYNAKGRIIMTSNRNVADLERKLGPDGGALLRRIKDDDTAQVLDYFNPGAVARRKPEPSAAGQPETAGASSETPYPAPPARQEAPAGLAPGMVPNPRDRQGRVRVNRAK